MSVARAVLHVDMDAFYASVEQHDDPRLAGLPVIVGGTGPRGVVAAASYEVRKFGVRSAMPMRQALQRCARRPCACARACSATRKFRGQVFAIFNEFTPLVQGLSLDEAFLDVTASREPVAPIARRSSSASASARALRPRSGAATNKLVAKIASDLNKPDGLTVVHAAHAARDARPAAGAAPAGSRRQDRRCGWRRRACAPWANCASAPDAHPLADLRPPLAALRDRAAGIDDRPVLVERQELSISAEDTFDATSTTRAGCARRWRNWPTSPAVEPRDQRADGRLHRRQDPRA